MPCRSAKGTNVLGVCAVSISKVPIITHVLGIFAVSISRVSFASHQQGSSCCRRVDYTGHGGDIKIGVDLAIDMTSYHRKLHQQHCKNLQLHITRTVEAQY